MLTSVPSHLPHLQFPEFLKVSSLCTATKASSLGLCLKLESQIKENSNVNWSITLFLCFSFCCLHPPPCGQASAASFCLYLRNLL